MFVQHDTLKFLTCPETPDLLQDSKLSDEDQELMKEAKKASLYLCLGWRLVTSSQASSFAQAVAQASKRISDAANLKEHTLSMGAGLNSSDL